MNKNIFNFWSRDLQISNVWTMFSETCGLYLVKRTANQIHCQ